MMQTDLFDNSVSLSLLEKKFQAGKMREAALLKHLEAAPIHDVLVPHNQMEFLRGNGGKLELRVILKDQVTQWMGVHRHALNQMCSKVKLPITYIDHLMKFDGWGDNLARENLNGLFSQTPFKKQDGASAKFLLRTVNGIVLGFLSRHYALHLSTDPLLQRFIGYCEEQQAKPVDATWSETRLQLQYALPHVYQPFPRQNIVIGMSFFNSDFGSGVFSIYPAVLDIDRGFAMMLPQYALGETMDKELFKKIHLGPLLQAEDLNAIGSNRARRTEEVAQQMRSNMSERLSSVFCTAVCQAIAKSKDTTKAWATHKRVLAGMLLKEELACLEQMMKERHAKLPTIELDEDGLPVPSNWWVAQAVSFLASVEDDPDRKIDLQQEAGKFIVGIGPQKDTSQGTEA